MKKDGIKKDGNLKGKKTVITTVHVIAVIFLVLSLCGITYAVDAAGGSIYEIFRETNGTAESEGIRNEKETGEGTGKETKAETKSPNEKETKQETKPPSDGKSDISYRDEDFREQFYSQIKEAIEYTWYVRAFEDGDGEIDLNKVVVSAVGPDEAGIQYRIRDLIQYTERYGTYETGSKKTSGDAFADYYWNTLLKVTWCSF